MKTIRSLLIAFLSIALVTCGYNEVSETAICDQVYALCTSATCIPDPNNPEKTICECEVLEGKSFGNIRCDRRKPRADAYGATHLVSTYSFHDLQRNKIMLCPKGKPWSDCLDQPCVVDPQNPSVAICSCNLKHSEAFVTYGGDCDLSTCDKGYFSGAGIQMNEQAMHVLAKALKITAPKNFCPGHYGKK